MGTVNSCPVVSQAKSLVLAAGGDFRGALRIQSDFIHEFPLLSQLVSLYYICIGQRELALWTQRRFLHGMSCVIDCYPGLGHAKALVQFIRGARESSRNALQSSTRSLFVCFGAVQALQFGVAYMMYSAIAVGFLFDECFSDKRPYGVWQVVEAARKNPTPSTVSDAFFAIFADALVGLAEAFPQYVHPFYVPFVPQNIVSPPEDAKKSAYKKPFKTLY